MYLFLICMMISLYFIQFYSIAQTIIIMLKRFNIGNICLLKVEIFIFLGIQKIY